MSFVPETSLGENARIFIGDASLMVVKGTITENPQEIDTGCNLTGGYTTRTRGRYNLELSVEMQWTVAQNPVGNPPRLTPGVTYATSLRIYPDFANDLNHSFQLPVFYVVSATTTIDGVGIITYQVQIKNQGQYTSPFSS